MKNQENVAVANVVKTKVAKKIRVAKVIPTTEVAVVEAVVETKKIALNKIQKSLKMLQKISGVSEDNLTHFLMKHFASLGTKVKIADHLTKMVLKIAAGTITIPVETTTQASEIFIQTMVEKFGLEKNQLEKFVINQLTTKRKVVLNSFFKDMFFKASTNPEFVAKINAFKRF